MKYFVTSDLHLGHENIILYCNRPFKNITEMDYTLINNWNSVVAWDDTVIHVGDFSFGNSQNYISRLNGNIIFIKGNHDDVSLTRIENLHFKYGGLDIFMAHDPSLAFISPSNYMLCGHIHGLFKEIKTKTKHIINVGTDVWNYKPINIEDILKLFNKND